MCCQKTTFCESSKTFGIILISFSDNVITAADVTEGVLNSAENSEDTSTCNMNKKCKLQRSILTFRAKFWKVTC